MSNFTCPTCGLTNIDCGKEGYKTAREIELEKKLDIAVKALKIYANPYSWDDCIMNFIAYDEKEIVKMGCFASHGFETAQQALKEIEECTYSEKA